MSPEIDMLNTYPVCGHERTGGMLYHIEIQKDWRGSDVEVPVYDIPADVRIAMAVARLSKQGPSRVTPSDVLE